MYLNVKNYLLSPVYWKGEGNTSQFFGLASFLAWLVFFIPISKLGSFIPHCINNPKQFHTKQV